MYLILLRNPVWPMVYVEVCCLFLSVWRFSHYLLVTDFWFDSTAMRKHSVWFQFLKCIEICLMTQDMVYLSVYSVALVKNMHFAVVGWNVLNTSIRSYWLLAVIEFFRILVDFYLVVFIVEGRVLRSPSVIVDLSVSLFSSICFCLTYPAALLCTPSPFRMARNSWWTDSYHYIMSPLWLW